MSQPEVAAPLSSSAGGADGYAEGHRVLDRYALTRPMAEGGTAVVWLARDAVLDVDVAVKIIGRPRGNPSDLLIDRAFCEARACAQLAHPAVCRVIDFGFTSSGDPVLVSELLHGETLDDLVSREGRLDPVRAVRTLLPILGALAAADAKGIVHRDVKPANIFLAEEPDGRIQPKLLDFGIARWDHVKSRTTTTGTVCGTPCYMSTEQARGSRDIDCRSDVWSSCATLYELVAGVPPFDGDNYNAVIWCILNTEPAALATLGHADATLSAIVARGLSKAPERRWSSAGELSHALVEWLRERGADTDVSGRSLASSDGASAARWPSTAPALAADSAMSRGERPRHFAALSRSRRAVSRRWLVAAAGFAAAASLWVRLSAQSAARPEGIAPETQRAAATRATPAPRATVHAARPSDDRAADDRSSERRLADDPPEGVSSAPEPPSTPLRARAAAAPPALSFPPSRGVPAANAGMSSVSDGAAPRAVAPSVATPSGSAPVAMPSRSAGVATAFPSAARPTNAMGYDFGL